MTVYFRPHGYITQAPTPRSQADIDLYSDIAMYTGLSIEIDENVDYEDWMEPACMLHATLKMKLETAILPKDELPSAMKKPIAMVPGSPTRDVLIGRQLKSDLYNLPMQNFGWPARNESLANRYAEMKAFELHAKRKIHLADMPGEAQRHRHGRAFTNSLVSTSLGKAMTQLRGHTCMVKQVYPAKSLPLYSYDIAQDTTEDEAKYLFIDDVGFHFAMFEGDPAALLVQERITMNYETRFFVVDGQVVTAAACIEAHTPQQNKGDKFDPLFEVKRNDGETIVDSWVRDTLWDSAKSIVSDIAKEAPDFKHYVLDLALTETGEPLMIELNPISGSGLYAVRAHDLLEAIIAAAEKEPQYEVTPKSVENDKMFILADDEPYED